MCNQVVMRKQVFVFLALVLASYACSLLLAIFFNPAPLANILGFLGLLSYIITLIPSILKVVLPATKKNQFLIWLLKYRRHFGVAAFCLGLNHGIVLIIKRNLDLLDLQTYIEYFQGFSILFIFTLLAVTSNDEAVKKLKNNWRRLHQLTYLVIFLLPWHILDKMSGHWTYLTPIVVLSTTVTAILFTMRKYIEIIKYFSLQVK